MRKVRWLRFIYKINQVLGNKSENGFDGESLLTDKFFIWLNIFITFIKFWDFVEVVFVFSPQSDFIW